MKFDDKILKLWTVRFNGKIKHTNKDDKTDRVWMSAHIHFLQQSG